MLELRVLLIVASLLVASIAGCFGEESAPASETLTTTAAIATGPNTTLAAEEPNTPPTASINASVLNGTAPLNITFALDGADADGDNLSWTLDADGLNGTDANGTLLPANVNFTFEGEGNFTAVFNVTDGVNTTSANVTLVVEIGTLTGNVGADDAAADSDVAYTDLLKVTFTLDEENLHAVLKLTDIWPNHQVLTPVVYNFHLNGRIFKSLGRYPIDASPLTWDTGASAYMAAGTSTWDMSAKTVTYKIPLEYLASKNVAPPYKMFGSVSIGAITNEAKQSDRAPNSGELVIG